MRHAAFALLFATSLFAADAPQTVTVLRAARLIDGRGGAVISPAVVVVRGNKIESVGGAAPAGAMSVTGGYGPSGYSPEVTYPRGVQIVDGVENARKAVREQIGNGADWIKVYADRSYFVAKDGSLSSIPTFTLDEMKAIVDEAHRLRHKVAAHAMARPGIENALIAGVDSIEHGVAIPGDLIDMMVAKGTYLCPTL